MNFSLLIARSRLTRLLFILVCSFISGNFWPIWPTNYIQAQAKNPPSKQERQLEELMQILYLRPEFKSSQDRVQIQGNNASIRVWRDLPPNPEESRIECLGYQWLLSGRGAKMGMGAKEVFKKFPNLQTITLELVELEFDHKSVNKRGKLQRVEKPRVYLRMRIKRSELAKFIVENKKLKDLLRRDVRSCLRVGRRLRMFKEIFL